MPDEHTPLIQVVSIAPQRHRYSHGTVRRFCTIALGTTLIVVVVLFCLPLRWLPRPHHHDWPHHPPTPRPKPPQDKLGYDDLVTLLLEIPKVEKLREWSWYYSSGPSLTGKNESQALWTRDKWQEWGIESEIVTYETYINYPLDHRLALLKSTDDGDTAGDVSRFTAGREGTDYKLEFECSLEEDVLEEDSTTGLEDRIPTFHGYSSNGNVTAQFVYVNYGRREDFQALVDAGVDMKGKIALARYGKIFRGMKVLSAEKLGMVGTLIYSDPGDDKGVTEENGYKPYPEGKARNPTSVQRGSVDFLSFLSGDPTTPGYPSLPGSPRQDPHWAIPQIPSLPISYQDALPLLKALNGHGLASSALEWSNGGLGYKGVEYNVGPSPAGTVVNLYNSMNFTYAPCRDVIGIINGTSPDEVVIIGNHRDAWIAGGAGDPHSGTATLLEVVRSFGLALQEGWRPRRTLVFASWSGEEQSLVGSTEWVEQFLPWLNEAAVAYLNVDTAAAGSNLRMGASPLLHRVLLEAAGSVPSPNSNGTDDRTALEDLHGSIKSPGSGSDFAPFLDHAGVPITEIGYAPGTGDAIYHYHSNYDSFHWMHKYGDPGFKRHLAVSQMWALMTAQLLETPVIPFNVSDYAAALGQYLDTIEAKAANATNDARSTKIPTQFPRIQKAIAGLRKRADKFEAKALALNAQVREAEERMRDPQQRPRSLENQLREVNRKYKFFERQFLYPTGLDGRAWFKHVVFAPR